MKVQADRLLLDLLRGELMPRRGPVAFRPNADVCYHRGENTVVVRLELPGIDPKRITLEIEGSVLHVSGMRSDRRPSEALYQQMEIVYGRFERAVTLPPDVDTQKASAEYNDGYLEITLPVRQRPAARQIPIGPNPDQGRSEDDDRP